jgi:two-component sensor histidine kinase/ActR/RegA family two-component response regulator
MGQLIRAFDWDSTPLGPVEEWPQVLRVLLDLMLSSSQPMFIVWGPERTCLYNDPYAEILAAKHPALGQPFEVIWEEIWQDLEPIVAQAYAGEALHMEDIPLMMMRKGYLEETHFSFSYTPVRGADGEVQGFLCPCLEITEQVMEERRARLRVNLTESFRTLRDPAALSHEAAALLARHFDVEQSAYAAIDEAGNYALIDSDWNNGSMPSNVGRHRLQEFGPAFIADLKAGQSIVIDDVREDPRTATPEALEAFDQRGIRAFLNVPHVRDGQLVAVLAIHSAQPKFWDPADIALAEEIAQRTHAAVESIRSEEARRLSEQDLRETRDALALATNASSLGWVTWDLGTGDATLDPCGREILGFDDATISVTEWFERVHPEDRATLESEVSDCVNGGRAFELAYRIVHPDGSLRHVHATGVFQDAGEELPTQGTGFVRDVTDYKRSEEHSNMLMAELDHRVKNILAVVQSIARQSLARGQELGPEAAELLIGRISALAQSHALLARGRWEGASFEALVENAISPHRAEGGGRIVVEGPDLKVTPKAAQTLTLALHEMVTNAAKYGALSRPEGRVFARWHFAGDDMLIFDWQERDGPAIEAPPSRRGFGSILIERMLAADLGGDVTLDFAPAGLQARIELPLDILRAKDTTVAPTSDTPVSPAGDRAALQAMKVLVVDDEHLVGQETTAALRAAGCSVIGPVTTLNEALNVVGAESFDAAVLDINLNGEFVWPAAQVVRAREIPFVFATGYSRVIDTPNELKDAPWVEKPIAAEQLIQSLAAALSDRKTPRTDKPDTE